MARERNPKPSVEVYQVTHEVDRETGLILREAWSRAAGEDEPQVFSPIYHRADGPAITMRDPENPALLWIQEWYLNGRRHRLDGPAYIRHNAETGVAIQEDWYRDGRRHRMDGPALTRRNGKTGEVTLLQWWVQGVDQNHAERPNLRKGRSPKAAKPT